MNNTARFFKPGLLYLLAVVAIPIAGYAQTEISAGTSTVSLNGDTAFNVTGLVDTTVAGTDALTKTNGGNLTINFSGTGGLSAGSRGIEITSTALGDLMITTTSSINPVITSNAEGLISNQRINGNFVNNASITSLANRAINIFNDGVNGSFSNTGNLLAGADGIFIQNNQFNFNTGAVNGNFTSSGQIGAEGQRVGNRGIALFYNGSGATLRGDFLNDGNIFSTNDGIFLQNNAPAQATPGNNGNFTNNGNIDSLNGVGVRFARRMNGIFTNNGAILAGTDLDQDHGIHFDQALNGGFTNSGSIGTAERRVGGDGILIGDALTGNFLNDMGGDIFSSGDGVTIIRGVTGNFTNQASIDAQKLGIQLGGLEGIFTNTGDILTGGNATDSPADNAIFITDMSGTGAVGTGFNNSGQLGTSARRTGGNGIGIITGTLDGDFLNDGDIFSTLNGISLENTPSSVTGNFTNNGAIDSSTNHAILINGNVLGSFNNSGALLTGIDSTDHGIRILGAVGAGFTNSGQIGESGRQTGSQGILVGSGVGGSVENNGAVFAADNGISIQNGIAGSFENTGPISSGNNAINLGGGVGASFINSAPLVADSTGLFVSGGVLGDFDNDGAVTADSTGIFVGGGVGGTVTITGSVISGSSGISINDGIGGSFVNSAPSSARTFGILLSGGVNGDFTNTAPIDSEVSTSIQIDEAVGGAFTNSGDLTSGPDSNDDGIFIGNTVNAVAMQPIGFVNSGQIGTAARRVAGNGIEILGSVTGSVLNDTGGDIFSTEQAIRLQAVTNDFTNNASISSLNDRAIEIRGSVGGHFTNAGSIIEAGAEGIYIEGGVSSFENIGAITDTSGRGVRIEVGVDGSFENTADFTNTGEDGISIEGDVGGSFFNYGNFSVIGGSGISIEGGAISSFENMGDLLATAGSAISINLGVGDLFFNSGTITNTGGSGISIDGAIGDFFENIGVITNTQGSGISIGGGLGGFFTNRGEITDSGGSGISIDGAVGGFFDNGGAISNTQGSGISLAAGVDEFFVNSGEITETGGSGISIDGAVNGTFENGAAISITSGDGIFLGDSVEDFFVNTGEISNTGGSGISIVGAVGGSFDNEGAISVTLGDGIFLGDSVGDFFINSGQISQIDGNGISISGIVFDFFENTGSIIGTGGGGIAIVGAVGGTFTNSGDIAQAGGSGISIEGAVGTLASDGFTNTGQIGSLAQRVSGRGVEIAGTVTGDFLNDVGGDIFSTFQGVFLQAGVTGDVINEATIDSSNDIGIRIDGPIDGTLTNNGTVIGFDRAIEVGPHPTTFINTGIINGNVVLGTATAGGNAGVVQNTVTLDSDGVINGLLDVGNSPTTIVTLTGSANAVLSTEVTGGINSGASTNQIDGALIKLGTSQWTIDQNLAVGQRTTINEGTLLIGAATTLTSSGDITLNNQATLAGTGTVDGPRTVVNGGTLAPGTSAGTLTFNNGLLMSISNLDYGLSTPGVVGTGVNDLIVVNGNLSLSGVLNVTDLGGFAEGSYTLIQATGPITDNGLTIGSLPPGFGGTISVTSDAVILEVVSINQPPVAANDEFLAFEDQVFSGNVFANNGAGADFDPDDDAFEVQKPGVVSAGGIGGSVDLSSNGNFTYTPPAATLGKAIFTYTIEDPFGATDSATVFIDVVAGADLVLEKTSGSFFTPPGGTINYEILVVNAGPSDVIGARVTDTPPSELSNVTWDCMAIDGATCQDVNGIDEIDQAVDIPNGGALMYTLSGTLPTTGNNPLTNSASVSNPIIELNPADNSDSDTDLVGLFADGMETEEP